MVQDHTEAAPANGLYQRRISTISPNSILSNKSVQHRRAAPPDHPANLHRRPAKKSRTSTPASTDSIYAARFSTCNKLQPLMRPLPPRPLLQRLCHPPRQLDQSRRQTPHPARPISRMHQPPPPRDELRRHPPHPSFPFPSVCLTASSYDRLGFSSDPSDTSSKSDYTFAM
ncbi:hypothetical protein [Sporisorium scitamineum]|uniref:Uncharacterized protein n=1 Tax=Sporisorium scitamineum TaxID=49012 RepID=A0A0F7RWK6_9BASI|nr:hypothetical protein [Sporisorium scitamineum]